MELEATTDSLLGFWCLYWVLFVTNSLRSIALKHSFSFSLIEKLNDIRHIYCIATRISSDPMATAMTPKRVTFLLQPFSLLSVVTRRNTKLECRYWIACFNLLLSQIFNFGKYIRLMVCVCLCVCVSVCNRHDYSSGWNILLPGKFPLKNFASTSKSRLF